VSEKNPVRRPVGIGNVDRLVVSIDRCNPTQLPAQVPDRNIAVARVHFHALTYPDLHELLLPKLEKNEK
jgi:hypothetical protein